MAREVKRRGSTAAAMTDEGWKALYLRTVYDAYYLAQGLLGGRDASMDAAEEAYRRAKTRAGALKEAAQDNLLLRQVIEVCRMRGDNQSAAEGTSDYVAFMGMPFRSRVVLILTEVLHLPDAVVADVTRLHRGKVKSTAAEAKADLIRRAKGALGPTESVEHIMNRNVEPLSLIMVEALWVKLGGHVEEVNEWIAPAMDDTRVSSKPIIIALCAAGAVLLVLAVLLLREPIKRRILSRETVTETGGMDITAAAQTVAKPERTPGVLTTTVREEGPTYEVTLTLGGDVVIGCVQGRETEPRGFNKVTNMDPQYPFLNLADLLKDDDLTVMNLDCVLTKSGASADGQKYPLRGKPQAAEMLSAGSVDVVTMENTHALDFGEKGLNDTIEALKENGIRYATGAKPLVTKVKGKLTVGIAALKEPITEDDLKQAIDTLKEKGAGCIILSLNWGDELSPTPQPAQETLARAAVDYGANIILGHHAHVVQRAEAYHGGLIFYSLGNVVYGANMKPTDWDIALARVTAECQGNEVVRLNWAGVPGRVSTNETRNDYQPYVYAPNTADAVRVLNALGETDRQDLADWKVIYDTYWPAEEEVPTGETAAEEEETHE